MGGISLLIVAKAWAEAVTWLPNASRLGGLVQGNTLYCANTLSSELQTDTIKLPPPPSLRSVLVLGHCGQSGAGSHDILDGSGGADRGG